jgi:NADPH:quinone reductase-like Zn-dependent oxidoreductase
MRQLIMNSKSEGVKMVKQRTMFSLPQHGDNILVKVLYASINPADFGFISGVYGRYKYEKYPKPLGFEGCGIVIDGDKSIKNKKVVFTANNESPK